MFRFARALVPVAARARSAAPLTGALRSIAAGSAPTVIRVPLRAQWSSFAAQAAAADARLVASSSSPGGAAAAAAAAAAGAARRAGPPVWDIVPAGVSNRSRDLLAAWIGGSAAWVGVLIVLGGVTRLTRSGLSMTDWKFTGEKVPGTPEEWEAEFSRYSRSPEFRLVNSLMTVDEFKSIYWMEYGHRAWARALGAVFLVPAVGFVWAGALRGALARRVALLFAAGGTQGLVGWWMVRSGLEEPENRHNVPRVSPYRLASHLLSAMAIYSGLLWTTLDVLRGGGRGAVSAWAARVPGNREGEAARALEHDAAARRAAKHAVAVKGGAGGAAAAAAAAGPVTAAPTAPVAAASNAAAAGPPLPAIRAARRFLVPLRPAVALIALTALSGAFVAGNDAGRAYNTFPTMNGEWIPEEYWTVPGWRNAFESTAAVQLHHRALAVSSLLASLGIAALAWGRKVGASPAPLSPRTRHLALAMAGTAFAQASLGVATLLTYVPPALGAAHQAGALALLTVSLAALHSARVDAAVVGRSAAAARYLAAPAALITLGSIAYVVTNDQ